MKDFISPTRGRVSFAGMVEEIARFLREDEHAQYKLIVGTDSQTRDEACFVTAVVVHRLGKGGRYFYQKRHQHKIRSLRQKIFYETSLSLGLASRLAEALAGCNRLASRWEIHIDAGECGETRGLIREIVGMVVGSGFDAKIKPDSFGASKVADRYTK